MELGNPMQQKKARPASMHYEQSLGPDSTELSCYLEVARKHDTINIIPLQDTINYHDTIKRHNCNEDKKDQNVLKTKSLTG